MKRFNGLKAVLFLAAFALVGLAFTTKANAATKATAVTPSAVEWKYDANKDALVLPNTTTGPATYLVYSAKNADKATASKETKSFEVQAKAEGETATSAAFTLSKVGTTKADWSLANNKDAYLFFADEKPSGKGEFTPDVKIAGTPVKKLAVNINYVTVVTGDALSGLGSKSAVVSILVTGTEKNAEPELLELKGDKYGTYTLEYSTDEGVTWADAKDLTGNAVYGCIDKKIMFRIAGTDGSSSNKTAGVRPSKAISVKIKKPAKAPKVAVDVNKGTIAIKNGMAYCVVASGNAFTDKWSVIPVYNKTSENKKDVTLGLADYTPKKFDKKVVAHKTDKAFTGIQFKTLAIDEIAGEWIGDGCDGATIYVQTAATEKGPASAITTVTIAAMKAAPEVHVTTVATEQAIKFAVTGSATSVTYEYCILNPSATDVDWSTVKWTKFDPSNGIKYSAKTAAYATLSKGEKKKAEEIKNGAVIYIREQGDKRNIILPSEIAKVSITNYSKDNKQIGGKEVVKVTP